MMNMLDPDMPLPVPMPIHPLLGPVIWKYTVPVEAVLEEGMFME